MHNTTSGSRTIDKRTVAQARGSPDPVCHIGSSGLHPDSAVDHSNCATFISHRIKGKYLEIGKCVKMPSYPPIFIVYSIDNYLFNIEINKLAFLIYIYRLFHNYLELLVKYSWYN